MSLLLIVLLVLINILIVCSYYHHSSNIRVRSLKLHSGFKKVISDKSNNIITEKDCPCFSGKSYDECCGMHHTGVNSIAKPSDVLRARYSAYRYSMADYIIDTSHSQNEDYTKFFEEAQASLKSGRKRWQREIIALNKENPMDYLHFNILKEDIINNGKQIITFEAIFKESDDKILAIIEESEFLYDYNQNKWLYKDSVTKDMDLDKTKQILKQLGLEFDIETGSLVDDTVKKTTNSNNYVDKSFIAPVLTNKGKLGVFNKNKKNYIPKGTSSS